MTTRTVPENSAVGTNVGSAVNATDSDSGDTLTYSLSSPLGSSDASSFSVDGNGQIKTKTGLNHNFNFEATMKSYSVTVQVRDSKDAAGNANTTVDDTIAVTINLTNVNEPPIFTVSPTSVLIPEQTNNIRAYQATDPDAGDTLSWSVDSSSPDFDSVTITTTGELRFETVRDFENPEDANADNFYGVTVQVVDAAGAQISVDVVVAIGNVNDAPVIISGPMEAATVAADENTPTTEIIATYQSYDQDDLNGGPMDILTWSLSGDDAGAFVITRDTITGAGILKFRNRPDFENPADKPDAGLINGGNNYDIIVQLTDGKDSFDTSSGTIDDTRTLTVTVEDVNEAPVISGDDSPDFPEIEFDVNGASLTTANLTVPGDYTFYDDNGNDVTWSLSGTDANHFVISEDATGNGVLTFKNPSPNTILKPADFENPVNMDSNNDYEIVVQARDDNSLGPLTGSYTVIVTVTNVNETPEITSTGTAFEAPSFAEIEWDAATVDLDVQTYTARDEEDGIVSITWSLGGGDAGDFRTTRNTLTGEGVLAFRNVPNFEDPKGTPEMAGDPADNTYEIIVKATDTASNARDYPVTVTVTNIDEKPEITTPSLIIDFPETPYDSDTPPGVIRTFTARDEEGDVITWSVEANDEDYFVITKNASGEGVLTFSTTGVPQYKRPDYERPEDEDMNNRHLMSVGAEDPAGNRADLGQVVVVTDVNERPEFIGPITTAVTYDENDTIDVGSYSARDEEPGGLGGVTWSLTGDDASDFVIDTGGIVTFVNTPSYEMPTGSHSDGTDIDGNEYQFTVVATDIESGSSRLDVTTDVIVTVADLEELGSITVDNPNPAVGNEITFTLSDPDGGIDVSAPIVGEPPPMTWDVERRLPGGNWQSVPAGNASSKTYEYRPDEDQTGDEIRTVVTYIDRRGSGKRAESEATAAVTADPITNAPPRFTGNRSQSILETDAGENVGVALTATDRDSDRLTFGLVDSAAASYFEINPNSGQLRTVEALDFETIFATSGGRLIFNATLHDGEDVDGSISGQTWQWSRSVNGRSNWLSIGGATTSSYTVAQDDTTSSSGPGSVTPTTAAAARAPWL